jgi:hypothetical protein
MDRQLRTLEEQVAQARSQVEESVKRADDSSIRNLEFLGFFAALISFTIGSIQLSAAQKAVGPAPLIVVLFGALLCAFAGFTFIVQRDFSVAWRRAAPVFALGTIALAVGSLL